MMSWKKLMLVPEERILRGVDQSGVSVVALVVQSRLVLIIIIIIIMNVVLT